jgi:hypothetical protein
VGNEAGSRRDRRIAQRLDPGESLLASAIFNTGSIRSAAFSGRSAPIIRLAVTDRRVIMFATNDFAFNLNLGGLLLAIPYGEIDRVESVARRVIGFPGLQLRIMLLDDSVLSLEASGLHAARAKNLAPILEQALGSHRGGGRAWNPDPEDER